MRTLGSFRSSVLTRCEYSFGIHDWFCCLHRYSIPCKAAAGPSSLPPSLLPNRTLNSFLLSSPAGRKWTVSLALYPPYTHTYSSYTHISNEHKIFSFDSMIARSHQQTEEKIFSFLCYAWSGIHLEIKFSECWFIANISSAEEEEENRNKIEWKISLALLPRTSSEFSHTSHAAALKVNKGDPHISARHKYIWPEIEREAKKSITEIGKRRPRRAGC